MEENLSSSTAEEIDFAKEKEDLKLLEAVLFVSAKYLNMSELVALTDLNPIVIRELLEKLKDKYEANESGLEIVSKGELWKMDVRQEFSFLVNRLATGSSEFSSAEKETLAIIAFKQPIKQSVIIKIRGNKSYDHIKKFAELGLLKRKKEGHTHILSLAEDFYDYFGISNPEGNPLKIVPRTNSKENFSEEGSSGGENLAKEKLEERKN
jgi:segregation and condensation protein B